jgi:histidyl-tRNA synthetase
METIKSLRGTRDILPQEAVTWHYLEAIARDILTRAGYGEIRTPVFEATELFARGIGEATDVVGKEMYSFTDRGDRSITLRPENTAGVVRALVEHNLCSSGQRLWYTGPMFRYERPQAGRQRQFHQLGAELFGSSSPRADAEIIALATEILQALGLKNLHLELNSVGDAQDRQNYRQALIDYLTPHREQLDEDSQDRLNRNPLRILDSKDTKTQEITATAPSILDYLSPASREHFEQTQALLSALDIEYTINPRLVRGLDYYTHTAFEIVSADLGAQATVCGGGRYDRLVEQLGGPSTPAIGWAMGLERLIILIQGLGNHPQFSQDFYLVAKGRAAEVQAVILAHKLRQSGFGVEMDLSGAAMGKQFKRADRSGAKACLVLGDSEAANQTIQLKFLATGEQISLHQSELLSDPGGLRQRLATISKSLDDGLG